jgi:hypothetical protein
MGVSPSKPFLAAPAVLGLHDPVHDGEPELVAGLPASPVEDILLEPARPASRSVLREAWDRN